LLFAFIYAVVWRGVSDLRSVPDDESFVAGEPDDRSDPPETQRRARSEDRAESPDGFSGLVVEDSEVLAPNTRFRVVNGMTSIGRSSASDIVLKSDDYVSGQHARLTRHGGVLYVEDIGSTNGTYVNDSRAVGATLLQSGDKVRVGSTTFRYSE
jgi:pSer/pThr/pTyr-binding forkhead associated (FHA) protein